MSLDGLDALTAIGGSLEVTGNSLLSDFAALGGVTTIGDYVYIDNNGTTCIPAALAADLTAASASTEDDYIDPVCPSPS